MEWEPQCPPAQSVALANGFYRITAYTPWRGRGCNTGFTPRPKAAAPRVDNPGPYAK